MLAAALLITSAQTAPEMGRVQMLRSLHIIAYVSPMLCTGDDEIAVQTFNVSGGARTNVPAADFGELQITITGKTADGEIIRDHPTTIEGRLAHGEDSIRCVTSAARRAGASDFTVAIDSGSYRFVD
ncbi:hypothetical protein [Brevundimonas sp. NPDC058933]|uniref:hypothetical protein n=1 Tax=Brevundimonas sp. NPDC058933 TaxID=3346673 RepID=UPI003BEEB389